MAKGEDKINNNEIQLTAKGAFQVKRFQSYINYKNNRTTYIYSTFSTIKNLYFETILN
jgi:uncharacterized beta-barrel protein YwiB (DUF1934 family)